jgi:hypothetical protein
MGRRSRKRVSHEIAPPPPPPAVERPRGGAAPPPRPAPAAPRTATYKSRPDEAPPAPWAPFPLTELCILISIVLLAGGFLFATGDRRAVMLGGGFLLVTLSAGELSFREHFAGYRSHTSLLAGLTAVLVAIPFYFAGLTQDAIVPIALVAGALAFAAFRRAFVRRSGGVGFRA